MDEFTFHVLVCHIQVICISLIIFLTNFYVIFVVLVAHLPTLFVSKFIVKSSARFAYFRHSFSLDESVSKKHAYTPRNKCI